MRTFTLTLLILVCICFANVTHAQFLRPPGTFVRKTYQERYDAYLADGTIVNIANPNYDIHVTEFGTSLRPYLYWPNRSRRVTLDALNSVYIVEGPSLRRWIRVLLTTRKPDGTLVNENMLFKPYSGIKWSTFPN